MQEKMKAVCGKYHLTAREEEVFGMICHGLSPAAISSTLHISIYTTYTHIQHIYEKMDVSSQIEMLSSVLLQIA